MKRHAWLLAVLGLLCMLFHLVARIVWGEWGGWPAWIGGSGLLFWLAWIFLDQAPLRRAAQSRAVRFNLVAGLLVLLAFCLAVGTNVLAHRHDHRWDLTTTGRHSLAPQTIQVLEGLEHEIVLLAFFPTGSTDETSFLDLLEAYQQHTDKLTAQLYDPWHDPMAARQYGVTSAYGTVILAADDAQQRLETAFDEEAMSNALLRLVSGVQHAICFLSDHGEADPDDDEPSGISGAVQKLEGQNYSVERTSIIQHGGIPEHCEVAVLAGPQVDLLPEEREALAAHLLAGRNALLMLEPLATPSTAQDLGRYGLTLLPDVVLDDNSEMRQLGFDPSHLQISPDQMDFHPVTSKLDSVVYLQLARSVSKAAAVSLGLNVQVFLRAGPGAWGETSLDEDDVLQPTEELDLVGNIGLAAAVEIADVRVVPMRGHDLVGMEIPGGNEAATQAEAPESIELEPTDPEAPPTTQLETAEPIAGGKLVVFGDAGFATNDHLLEGLNQDLFLNSIAWLADEEDQISIRPNEAASNLLDYDLLQALLMWFLCLIGVPGLAVAAALWTWLRRRKL